VEAVTDEQILLEEARRTIEWRCGASFCECATQRTAAEGFGHDYDPECSKCERGLIALHWDGTADHYAVADARRQTGGRTWGGGQTWHSPKGLTLTRSDGSEAKMTWDAAIKALTAPQEALF